jgi:hypothetical protein
MSRQARTTPPNLPHFQAWLKTHGASQAKQARAIGVSARCIECWTSGKRWPTVSALKAHPDGLRALAEDLEQSNGHG